MERVLPSAPSRKRNRFTRAATLVFAAIKKTHSESRGTRSPQEPASRRSNFTKSSEIRSGVECVAFDARVHEPENAPSARDISLLELLSRLPRSVCRLSWPLAAGNVQCSLAHCARASCK